MTLGEHLGELRTRLIRGIVALAVTFGVGWYFYEELGQVLVRPLHSALEALDARQVAKYEKLLAENPGEPRSQYFTSDDPGSKQLKPELTIEKRPVVTGVGEGFLFALKVATLFACFAGGPFLLWQMWQFIAAGLYSHERRVVLSYFPASIGLFLGGVLFGYFVMLPIGLYFLISAFPPEFAGSMLRLSEYFSFITMLSLALGLVFQLPLVMFALVHVDLVERATFVKYRAHFIVAAFVVSAVLTPPDPFTQSLMAVPMILLFELGLLATRVLRRKAPALHPETGT